MNEKLILLQYDSDPNAVLNPDVDGRFTVPEKLLYIFTSDTYFNEFVKKYNGQNIGKFSTITKVSYVYQITYHDQTLAVAQAPLGAPAATMYLDMLIDFGAKYIIAVGSCGGLIELPEGHLLIPTKALRDEGTSFHYLPAADWVSLDSDIINSIATTLTNAQISWQEVKTWTTDAIFRETNTKINAVKRQGCQVVEMECSALVACAEFRHVAFGQLLYTADTLAKLEHYDTRNWGNDYALVAMELAANSLLKC